MVFQKNNIKKSENIISNILGLIAILVIFFIGIFMIKNLEFIQFTFNPKMIVGVSLETQEKIREEITKMNIQEDKNKINVLVIGRGGGNHDAPDLTDTLILTSINTNTRTVSMLSIPRDLYVEYGDGTDGKINALYQKYYYKTGDKDLGMEKLKEKITEITGEKIDYFASVDFNGFTKVIDVIGGIEITIPKRFVDNRYPNGKGGYRTLIFKKGTWLFDGASTLKYVRSRHSTSDFDRSLRQQNVISSLKEKLGGSYFFKSPGKLKDLYGIFEQYIHTDLELDDMLKLAYKLKGGDTYDNVSFNLNDSCFYGSDTCAKGGFLYIPLRDYFSGQSVLLLDGTTSKDLDNYKGVQRFTNIIFNSPEVFTENHKVNIFNSLKINNLAGEISNDFVRYGFTMAANNSIGNTENKYKKSVIYYNKDIKDSSTLKVLQKFFKGEFIEVPSSIYATDGEVKIEIIIGEDYEDTFMF